MARKSQKMIDHEVLGRIKKRPPDWFSYFSINNQSYREDFKFVYVEEAQWDEAEITEYSNEKRPRLTFNMLPRYITNMAAEFSQNVPDVEVRSEHFTEVAQPVIDITTNILRNISLDSRNDVVYKTAAQCAWTGGYGAFRIAIEREHPTSFNFVPRYKAIHEPTNCFWDPSAKELDKSDGGYCGISIILSKNEFKTKYPKAKIPNEAAGAFVDNDFIWVTKEDVTLVDYWEKVPVSVMMALLSDNTVVPADEAEKAVKQKNSKLDIENEGASGVTHVKISKIEKMTDHKIMFYRASRDEILESYEWRGKLLPIIFVPGISKRIRGRERTYGLVHWMKDAQKAYNYARSEYLYRLQLTRYEKFIVTSPMIANHQTAWKNPHKARSALVVDHDPHGAAPIIVPPQPVGNDLQNEMTRSLQDLQLIPGRFDPNFGGQGNEISGVAIATRQTGGNLNVKEFFDNVFMAVESGIRVISDMLPRVLDTSRRVAITNKDGTADNVLINTNPENTLQSAFFNVKLSVGSSFAIQQAENVEKLIKLTQADPKLAPLSEDIIIENLDIKHGPQLVERIKRWNIPTIAASEGSKDPIVIKNAQQAEQNPQQQMQQQAAQIELQSRQLGLQKQQQDIMISHMTAMDDRMKAIASQGQAQAAIMNADTNRGSAAVKGAQESQKMKTEEDKSRDELQIEQLKFARELAKDQMPQQQPQQQQMPELF